MTDTNTEARKRLVSMASTAVGAIVLLGPLVYSIWACFSPYAEPAASFIEWQARWGEGRYYVKATFLATWLTLMLAGAVAVSLLWAPVYAIKALLAKRPVMPSGPEWSPLPTKGYKMTILGLILGLVPSASLYAAVIDDAEQLQFLGQMSILCFVIAPLLFAWGWVSLLNLVLPRRVVVGPIDNLREERDQQGRPLNYIAVVGGEGWSVPLETWRQLSKGVVVAIVAPAITTGVLSLRVQSSQHYR